MYTFFYQVTGTDSMRILQKLEELMDMYGWCRCLVTDNAPNLVSKEVSDWCTERGIQHITLSPYSPSSNGIAELGV